MWRKPPKRLTYAEKSYLCHAFGEAHPVELSTIPTLSSLPDSLIMGMYEDIVLYGPNGENVEHMKNQLLRLIQSTSYEELEGISMNALQLIEKSIPTFDIHTGSARIRYCIQKTVKDSLSELPHEFPSYLLSFVAELGFNGYDDFIWSLTSAHTKLFIDLCELIGEHPDTYGFKTLARA